jgi:glycosyltransferase involved in cell wall biosynthesis
VVPNGVAQHPVSQPQRERSPGDPPTLLYVGVLRESKGLLVLVEACRHLHSRGLEFRLHLAGAFESDAFESALRGAVTEANLEQKTAFLGVIDGAAKASCFQSADVFCYPTHFEAESFGTVLAEAMQFSLPVVATRWRGVPSVVADGESGLLVPPHDPPALAGALHTVIEDPVLRRRMGKRGRELYLERFTEERFRRRMEAVLSGV